MSKEKIRKVIEGMEKSGKMKNVVLAKQVKEAQGMQFSKELEPLLIKLEGVIEKMANTARNSKDGDFSAGLMEVCQKLSDHVNEMDFILTRDLFKLHESPGQ